MTAQGALLDKPNTVMPSEQDARLATESSRILSAFDGKQSWKAARNCDFRLR